MGGRRWWWPSRRPAVTRIQWRHWRRSLRWRWHERTHGPHARVQHYWDCGSGAHLRCDRQQSVCFQGAGRSANADSDTYAYSDPDPDPDSHAYTDSDTYANSN